MCLSPCSMATSRACSRASAPFAAICASRALGEVLQTQRNTFSRAKPPAIGIKRSWNSAKRSARRNRRTARSAPSARWCRAHARGLADEIPAPRKKRAAGKQSESPPQFSAIPQGRTLLVQRSRRARRRSFFAHVAIPRRRSEAQRQQPSSEHLRATLGINGASSTRSAARSAPRRHVSQYHAAAISRPRRRNCLPKRHTRRVLPLESIARLPVSSATRKIANAATSVHTRNAH